MVAFIMHQIFLRLYLQQQGLKVSGSKRELAERSSKPHAWWEEVWGREYSLVICLHLWTKVVQRADRIKRFCIQWMNKWFWIQKNVDMWRLTLKYRFFPMKISCKLTVKTLQGPVSKQQKWSQYGGRKRKTAYGDRWVGVGGGGVGRLCFVTIFGIQEGFIFSFSSRVGRKKPYVLPSLFHFSTPPPSHPIPTNYCTVPSSVGYHVWYYRLTS